jgi:uncharacterized protein YecT (DUF1311 family)
MRAIRFCTFLCILAAGWAANSNAVAQKPAEQRDCSSAGTTAAMRTCEVGRYRMADADLRTVYSHLFDQLDSPAKAKLAESQSAWEHYREADSEFHADTVRGGTMAPLLRMTVLADMTETRAAELKKLLK